MTHTPTTDLVPDHPSIHWLMELRYDGTFSVTAKSGCDDSEVHEMLSLLASSTGTDTSPHAPLTVDLDPPESVVPVARLGAPDCPLGTALRVCDEYVTPVPYQAAELLGLEGTAVVQRWITLLVDGEPLLASTSYVPTEVAGGSTDDGKGWQDSDIGALALVGHTVKSTSLECWTGPPTPAEAILFRMSDDHAVTVLSRRYRVEVGERSLIAGVTVLAPYERLVLKLESEQSTVILLDLEPEAEDVTSAVRDRRFGRWPS